MQEIVEYERRITAALKRIEAGIETVSVANAARARAEAEVRTEAEARIAAESRARTAEAEAEAARGEAAAAQGQAAQAKGEAAAARAEADSARGEAEAAVAAAAAAAAAVVPAPEPEPEPTRNEPILAKMRERLQEAREREAVMRAEFEKKLAETTAQLDSQGLEAARLRRVVGTLTAELGRLREAAAAGLSDPTLINRAMLAELDALRAARLAETAELEEISAALDTHLQEVANA
ncbi:hypothetical protein [Pseudogemmobacter faecipullorum]|uniref:Colicin transporter n=1 Tax=Pseudogemmobacter faecipullorum TaxID=2755041 RepID=A0ABS8CKW6_9RHOB|nr:hypothetical protein [Pseudogemmobacter faecipullorum]MCB5410041.1 hypothetical protein [Pseudogemmobacter faecipullorum]